MPEMTNAEIVQDRQEGFGNPEEKNAENTEVKEVKEVEEIQADEPVEEDGSADESTDDTGDTEESEEDDSDVEEVSETEDDDTEDIIPKKEKVPGYQKRIDKLTAEKYRLEAELKILKESKKEEPKQEKRYTEEQLNKAKQKAIADNDLELLAEVFKEEQKNLKLDLINQYENEKKQVLTTQAEKQRQWNTIVERYGDESDPNMDIRNVNSQLYKVAKSYFEDPDLSKEYSGHNGMLRAVADAFLELSKVRKKNKLKSPKEKKLEQKLLKEKRKSSLGNPSHDKAVKPVTNKPTDSVMDYIQERQSVINKALGNK